MDLKSIQILEDILIALNHAQKLFYQDDIDNMGCDKFYEGLTEINYCLEHLTNFIAFNNHVRCNE